MTDARTWALAEAIYEGRLKDAWGSNWVLRPRFPYTDEEKRAFFHNPIADVELALASAREVIKRGLAA